MPLSTAALFVQLHNSGLFRRKYSLWGFVSIMSFFKGYRKDGGICVVIFYRDITCFYWNKNVGETMIQKGQTGHQRDEEIERGDHPPLHFLTVQYSINPSCINIYLSLRPTPWAALPGVTSERLTGAPRDHPSICDTNEPQTPPCVLWQDSLLTI